MRTYDDVEIDGLKAALLQQGQTELEALVGTIAETLLEQGSERGFAKGMAEGEAKGKAETLRMMLARRFGPVPQDLQKRIDAASLEELHAWLDALLDAPSIDAVFRSGRT